MLRTLILTTTAAISLMGVLLFAQEDKSKHKTSGTATTLNGVVSDSMCGAEHMAKDKSAAECTRECGKSGSDYALVVGKNVYTLKGNASDLHKYAGERVTVKGSASGNTINAESISPTK